MTDAVALAALVARGEVSALELVEAAIARIEAVDGALQSVVTRIFDRSRNAAATPSPGPFSGVPILLKETTTYPGLPSTRASRAFRNAATSTVATFVERIEAAGFIVLGRTNAAEFAALPITQPSLFGPTRNPWNSAHDAGGSSGGAAAAVAARIVPLAQGVDGGGSIRIPASACGVFGLKPSRGLITPQPAANWDGLGVPHALTLSVRDSAAFLDAIAGTLPGDRWRLPERWSTFGALLDKPESGLRIAVALDGFMHDDPAHSECRAAVEACARLCGELGHHVESAAPSVDYRTFNAAFLDLAAIAAARVVADLARCGAAGQVEAWTLMMAERGRMLPPWAQGVAMEAFERAAQTVAVFQADYDVILTPVLHRPPLRIGELVADETPIAKLPDAMMAYSPHTPLSNATGQPAMSVPLYWTAEGLPIGVQAIGRVGEDARLLRLARQLEIAAPWADRLPPVHAV